MTDGAGEEVFRQLKLTFRSKKDYYESSMRSQYSTDGMMVTHHHQQSTRRKKLILIFIESQLCSPTPQTEDSTNHQLRASHSSDHTDIPIRQQVDIKNLKH